MAKPIAALPVEATPFLYGSDARKLLDSLRECAPPEEIARRREEARQILASTKVGPFLPSVRSQKSK